MSQDQFVEEQKEGKKFWYSCINKKSLLEFLTLLKFCKHHTKMAILVHASQITLHIRLKSVTVI